MIKPSKKLKQLIEMYPTSRAFCEAFGVDEATISRMLSGDRGVPEIVILSVQTKMEWKVGDIIEVVEDK